MLRSLMYDNSDLSCRLDNISGAVDLDMLDIGLRRYTLTTITRQYESLY